MRSLDEKCLLVSTQSSSVAFGYIPTYVKLDTFFLFYCLLAYLFTKIYMQEFPPKSKLDPKEFGSHTSTITEGQMEENMNGLTVDQVITTLHFFFFVFLFMLENYSKIK